MHDVVVMAVRKAVRAATITFTAISMILFFMIRVFYFGTDSTDFHGFSYKGLHSSLLYRIFASINGNLNYN